ncbi:hypothetical protein AAHC03_016758 [Spirometra sp. Aus1]
MLTVSTLKRELGLFVGSAHFPVHFNPRLTLSLSLCLQVRACVWNEARQEVYTAGMDNNLHVWSFFPDPVEDPPGSENEDATGANFL